MPGEVSTAPAPCTNDLLLGTLALVSDTATALPRREGRRRWLCGFSVVSALNQVANINHEFKLPSFNCEQLGGDPVLERSLRKVGTGSCWWRCTNDCLDAWFKRAISGSCCATG
eukprot:5644043-Amphidinium_carterae.2